MNQKLKSLLRSNERLLTQSTKNLHAVFTGMFANQPNIMWEENDGFRITRGTYGQVYGQIVKAAGSLYQKIGATHQYVALEMENCPHWIVAFWAIVMSGNKPYLVNTRYPGDFTQGILQTLNISVLICQEPGQLQGEYITVESLLAQDTPPPPEDVFEDQLAFSSSATSMNQVICFYTGEQIANQILNFRSIVKSCPSIVAHYKGRLKQLAFLPFYHVFGLFAVFFWYCFFGQTLVFLKDYAPDTIIKTCRRHEVTHIFAVPMLWHTVEKQVLAAVEDMGEKTKKKFFKGLKIATALQNLCPFLGNKLAKKLLSQVTRQLFGPSVQFTISGGSYLRDSALYLLNGLGYNLHNGFGMSEIGITSVELRSKPKYRNLNAIGRPFDSVEYQLKDGQLLVRGSSLCTEKWVNGQPQPTESWFATGDLAKEEKGDYYLLGRLSDMIIGDNGENINPDQLEKYFHLPSAKSFCILGLSEQEGEQLSLIVQANPFATPEQLAKLRDQVYSVNQTLSTAMQITRFYVSFDDLAPPTAVKVSRAQLRKKLEQGEITLLPFNQIESAGQTDQAESPLMREVKAVIAKVLNVNPQDITPATHVIYDLGASSMQYFALLTALAERFDMTGVQKNDTYCYTLKDMTDYIERHL